MGKCYIHNLGMIVTEKCNLDCEHCLRGKKTNKDIKDEIIEKTLDNIKGIGCLNICGGEPTIALNKIEKIIDYIILNHIRLDYFTVTINGTIYSEEFLKLLDEIYNYTGKEFLSVVFAISFDKYHLSEIKRLEIEEEFYSNLKKYEESNYFYGYRTLNKKDKLFREGNASNLDKKSTVPLKVLTPYLSYIKDGKLDRKNGLCNIGPLITVNVDGILTECNASNDNQRTLYNYGNINDNSIEDILINNNIKILKPNKFEKECRKTMKKYLK